jgi:hypothetical protein
LTLSNEKYIAYTRALDELYVYDKIIEIPEDFVIEGKATPNSNNNINQTTPKTIQKSHKGPASINSKIDSASKGSTETVRDFFLKKGLTVVDQRKAGGYLWIKGDKAQLEPYITEARSKFGMLSGTYSSCSKALGFVNGWYTKTKK